MKNAVILILLLPGFLLSANITINTGSTRSAISPLIYGTNQQMNGDENLTIMRLGGNRMTAYNWENNASNAGSDWYHSSDDFMCGALENPVNASDCANVPGAVIHNFIDYCNARNYETIVTLPMAGYVAADKLGNVTAGEAAPSARWKIAQSRKGSAFSDPPNTADNYVYADEEVDHIVKRYGNAASANGVRFYQLDNEGDLWDSTHLRIHPTPVGAYEWVTRGVELAKAVKDVDPNAEIMGPVYFGLWSMLSQGGDWNTVKGSHSWYASYYLAQMKSASDADGRRLLDVFDIHYYTESRQGLYPPFTYNNAGQCRITEDACTSAAAQLSRLQSPRSLWDATYTENSSLGEWGGTAMPVIPKAMAAINTYYPGTKLSFTEHGFGGGNDYSGGICVADVLGIFGKYGVYVATMWKSGYGPFHSAAYKLYRNYDGSNATYGDTKVYCESNDVPNMTTYASINGTDESTLHVIVLNKAATAQSANFSITSSVTYQSGEAYGFGGTDSSITLRTAPTITGNSFTYSVPAYSAYHFVLHGMSGPTFTPTFTRTPGGPTDTPTFTSTPTYTFTFTPTVGPGVIIYDGDTRTLAAGTVVNSADGGGITQVTGGMSGNAMQVDINNPQSWWQQHDWNLTTNIPVGSYDTLEFYIKSTAGTANGFQIGLGWTLTNWNVDIAPYTQGGAIDNTWRKVSIPLSVLLGATDTTVDRLIFIGNSDTSYTVLIDNVRLTGSAASPTYTYTQTWTPTYTFTQTRTSTNTAVVTNTFTTTATQTSTAAFTYTYTPTNTNANTSTNTPVITSTFTNTAIVTATVPTSTSTHTTLITPTFTSTHTATAIVPTYTFTQTSVVTQTLTHTVTLPVFTFTYTQTPVITSTETAVSTVTETPVTVPTKEADKPEIIDLKTMPSPYTGGNLIVNFSLTRSMASLNIRIYTGSYRLIREIQLKTTPGAGEKTTVIAAKTLNNLANGTYYCVIEGDDSGNKITSKLGTIVIIKKQNK